MDADLVLCSLLLFAPNLLSAQTPAPGRTEGRALSGSIPFHSRLVDVDGDGRLDRVAQGESGVVIGLGTEARGFEPTSQILPVADAVSLLSADLNADGALDLYFLSRNRNVALLGDGSGSFIEATAELGLADTRPALSAEYGPIDGDEFPDLLLHNEREDVLFYGLPGGGFERAESPVWAAAPAAAVPPSAEIASLGEMPPSKRAAIASHVVPTVAARSAFVPHHARIERPSVSATQPSPAPTVLAATSLSVQGLTSEQKKILDHMSLVQLDDGNGNPRETIRISGANLQIVNGLGATNGAPSDPSSIAPGVVRTNGLGNLILGYDESPSPSSPRSGSHNLVLGRHNSYTSFGGLVAGADNAVDEPFATISGGQNNSALAPYSSVSGGRFNTAQGLHASVTGGLYNRATTTYSAVSGGFHNRAGDYGTRGLAASITGGSFGAAYGAYATISGGVGNEASGRGSAILGGAYNVTRSSASESTIGGGALNSTSYGSSSVSAGLNNTAAGYFASVSGGYYNSAFARAATVSGGARNSAQGYYASVSAGSRNLASGTYASVSGGKDNRAIGTAATVSGGSNRAANATSNWVAGSLFEAY